VRVELGGAPAVESRRLVFELHVPSLASLAWPLKDGPIPREGVLRSVARMISDCPDKDAAALIHCRSGVNCSCLVAGRVLMERGMGAEAAIYRIGERRKVRSATSTPTGSGPKKLRSPAVPPSREGAFLPTRSASRSQPGRRHPGRHMFTSTPVKISIPDHVGSQDTADASTKAVPTAGGR
jgi:hypothetical protein